MRRALLLAAVMVSMAALGRAESIVVPNKHDLADVVPEAGVFVSKTDPFIHYLAYDASGSRFVGVAFLTTDVVPADSWGYRDQIATLVGLSAEGVITGVKILEEHETPRYTKGLLDDGEWFLLQFVGKSADDPFLLGGDVAGISGATISSSAIAVAIEAGVRRVMQDVLYQEVREETPVEHLILHHVLWQIDFLFVWILAGLAWIAFATRHQMLRSIVLAGTILYVGFMNGGGLSVYDILNVGYNNWPVFLNNLYWYSLVFLGVALTLVAGRFYCGWLCPFGAATEVLHGITPWRFLVPEKADRYLKLIKYVNLVLIITVAFFLWNKAMAVYLVSVLEPFATFFRLYGGFIAWVFLGTVLLLSAVIPRFYCRYLCPLGAFFASLVLISEWTHIRRVNIRLGEHGCKGCRVSEKSCQMKAIEFNVGAKKPEIDPKECLMCGTCRDLCPVKS
ncbi:MAG: 4Fe-4S binding protein [Candidatus Omnitrophica bacterium]|nr:4Fe-4S binding protein [Candidatus Omnitrophota bacterium]